jgi:imidazoleglycerol-phosphate dehydratase
MEKRPQQRQATKRRTTLETDIDMSVNLYGRGEANLKTGIAFFEHMLSHFAKQSLIDINLVLKGDLEIDCHHSVEDTAIVLGGLLHECLGDKSGINRYGHFTLPMDETLTTVALDLGGRYHFSYKGPEIVRDGKFEIYDAELTLEFLEKLAMNAKMNLHVIVHYGENRHHIHESIFKALGRAMQMAVTRDPDRLGAATTKGVLE